MAEILLSLTLQSQTVYIYVTESGLSVMMSDPAYSDSAVLTIAIGDFGSYLGSLSQHLEQSDGDVVQWLVETADRFPDLSNQLLCNMTKRFQLPPSQSG